MVSTLRSAIRAWIGRIFFAGSRMAAAAQQNALCASLAGCGSNVHIFQPVVFAAPSRIVLGDDVSIAPFVHIWGNGGVKIGARTMIASHVAITSATHDPTSLRMRHTLCEQPVEIGEDVWIGAHAVILPGVRIGRGAVIAAGCVVVKDVEPFTIVAGVPARLVKTRSVADIQTSSGMPL